MRKGIRVALSLLFCVPLLAACGSMKERKSTVASGAVSEDVAAVPAEAGVANAAIGPFEKKYGRAELQADFNKLKGLIQNVHPKLYADEELLAGLLEKNYGLIADGMTELEFFRLLSPIVSALNCGHTSISLSPSCQEQLAVKEKYFPLPLRFIAGKAYIIANGFAPEIPVGSELLTVNGKTMSEITDTLLANISADGWNTTHKIMILNGWFRYKYQNFMESAETFAIGYRPDPAAASRSAELPGVTNEAWARVNPPVWPAESSNAFASRFEDGYAVLTMYSFYPEGRFTIAKYKAFIDAFFSQVREKNITSVILDVRDNGGGDPYVTSHLFTYLAGASQPYFSKTVVDYYSGLKSPVPLAENRFGGRLYVLMNGGSFSSTGHLLALLKYQKVGIFIGEESGASFACTDASRDYSLQNTGIQFRSSTLVWDVAVEGLVPGRGIMPDHEVVPTLRDYLDKRDSVLEFAVGLISRAR